jgi:hypothetical protein
VSARRGWAPARRSVATGLWALAAASGPDLATGQLWALVQDDACTMHRQSGQPVPRELWDFKDLSTFVAAAPRDRQMRLPLCGEIPVRILGT